MRPRTQPIAILLLAVFAVGGLLSPLAHRISHVHTLEHQHGQAAAHFTAALTTNADFYVEEQTPPHELACDLCARLTLAPLAFVEASTHPLHLTSTLGVTEERRSGLTVTLSRIRAPPVLS